MDIYLTLLVQVIFPVCLYLFFVRRLTTLTVNHIRSSTGYLLRNEGSKWVIKVHTIKKMLRNAYFNEMSVVDLYCIQKVPIWYQITLNRNDFLRLL